MPLVVVGLDHKSSPNDLLRRATISSDAITYALDRVIKSDHVNEAVILSTCLRTEIYLDALRFHGAVGDARDLLCDVTDLAFEDFTPYLVERHDEAVSRHLFLLAAGVESVMVGEGEILGQIGRAWQMAQTHGSSRSVLNGLFRHALVVGKRARNETRVGAGITSIGTAALALVEETAGLVDKSVLVVGAGDVATKVAFAAKRANVSRLSIANRTFDRAARLADRTGGVAVDLESAVGDHDVVIVATGAVSPVIGVEDVSNTHPTTIVDLGMPPDVDPLVEELEDVSVLHLRDVESFVNRHRTDRLGEFDLVGRIVEDEVRNYFADVNERVVGPLVSLLHQHGEAIRTAEMKRFDGRLADLEPDQRRVIEDLTKAMLSKLLHGPTIGLKASAGTPEGERNSQAIRNLFEL